MPVFHTLSELIEVNFTDFRISGSQYILKTKGDTEMVKKRSFNDILTAESVKNGERLMSKARIANRVAKASNGPNRQSAYKIKASTIERLLEKFPNKVRVHRDIRLNDFVVVALKNNGLGLHFPAEKFTGHVHRSMV